MTDPTLSPTKNTPKPPPKGKLVTLGIPMFVLKARFTGPDGKDRALPKHKWSLLGSKGGKIVVAHVGTESDADGISSIPKTDDLGDAAMSWHLSWQPVFDDFNGTLQWTTTKEAWIDLDKKPTEKGAWVSTDKLDPVEKRRLVRMPVWTTKVKAQNGQFNEVPNDAFKTTGVLTAADIDAKLKDKKTFGTRAKPWLVNVDHQWFRTFVHFRFFDFKKKDESVVPPGLLVRAKKADGTSVGGGTAFDLDGTIFVLHERTKAASTDADYEFATPDKFTIVDLEAAAPKGAAPAAPGKDKRTVKVDKLPDGGPPKRYLLPTAWHSRAMQAFLEGATPRPRKAFTALRTEDTTLAKPLAFHLDDVVLFDAKTNAPSVLAANSRVVLFDHRLRFRGPFDPVFVHMLQEKLAGKYLRAEDLIVRKNDEFKDSTFVINHEGDFFVLREGRITGTTGTTDNVGARSAVARAPENPIGNFLSGYASLGGSGTVELHFFPDAYDGPYTEADEGKFLKDHPTAKLCHVLVNVPLKVIPASVGPKKFDAPTNADLVLPANMNSVYQALVDAASRWDQAHPANGAASKKDIVIVPDAGVKDGTRVVKLRHYFGVRTDNAHKFTILATYKNQLTTLGDRAFVSSDPAIGALMSLVLSPRPPAAPAFTSPGSHGKDSDGVDLAWFTLAHELGHTMGLPDEYGEGLSVPDATGTPINAVFDEPRIIRFGQAHEGYPFYADLNGMMRSNKLPRLRYVWHHVNAFLNNGSAKAALPEGPYVSQEPTFPRGLTHKIADGNATQPWGLLGQRPGPGGRSNLVLYRAGDDEATVEKVFPRPASAPATPGTWIQGILVVSTKIWFNFLPSVDGNFPNVASRFALMQTFHKSIFDVDMSLKQRFVVEGAATLRLPRIGILFQPRLEYGPNPQPLNGFSPPNVTEANADIVVDVVFQSAPPLKNPITPAGWPPSTRPRLVIGPAGVGTPILRFAVGISPSPAISSGPIVVADLAPVAGIVQTMLGDPAGSAPRTVKALPT